MNRYIRFRLLPLLLSLIAPFQAHAQRTLGINLGSNLSVEAILTNIINYMGGAILFVASACFAMGAFYMTFSRGDPDLVNRGRGIIIGSVIGMAVVLGAFAILRTVFFFIYA
jgi:hypothetical protein